MIEIKIESEKLQKAFEEIINRAHDRRPLMRKIAGVMHAAVEKNFDEEGRPEKWVPLSQKTIKIREKKGYWPGYILQQTGRLKSSISEYADNDKAVVGTNLVYAAIHQFGGKAGKGKKVGIPARPFLGLTDEDIQAILKLIEEYLKIA